MKLPQVTSDLPRMLFDNPDDTFRTLALWTQFVGGKSADITGYGQATITLNNNTQRKARWSPVGQEWVWEDEYLPG